jgi:ABC-type antimicrobial peptide transport system permease subunit
VLKSEGYGELELWRWLLCEAAVLLTAGCLIGAIFGIYAQLLGSHFLSAVTGFPIVFNVEPIAAIASFAMVTIVAIVMLAWPGFRAVRVRPRTGGSAH